MAIVAGVRSTLNPNAPLFIPSDFSQVEDFSPEWWELVKTSTWFRVYWLSQHPEDSFTADNGDDGEDIDGLLTVPFEVGLEEQLEKLAPDFGAPEKGKSSKRS